MNEKPRPADESILTKDFLSKIGLEGLVIGVMTMISFLTGYHQDGALLGSTYAFGTLCLARLFHGYNCKSDHPVIFTKRFFNNKWMQAHCTGRNSDHGCTYNSGAASGVQSRNIEL